MNCIVCNKSLNYKIIDRCYHDSAHCYVYKLLNEIVLEIYTKNPNPITRITMIQNQENYFISQMKNYSNGIIYNFMIPISEFSLESVIAKINLYEIIS